MSKLNAIFKLSFRLYIFLIIINLKIFEVNSFNIENKLIYKKQLGSSDKLFMIYKTGLYIYNNKFSKLTNIYKFNNEQKNLFNENNEINILASDFNIKDTEYYLNVINNFLFIYNTKSKNFFFYKLYNEPNIKPIMMRKNNSTLYSYLIKGNSIIMSKISLHSNHNTEEMKKSTLYKFNKSSLINCQMDNNNKNKIQCLCYQNDFIFSELYLENYDELSRIIRKKINFPYKNKSLKKIESVISNNNNFFVCSLDYNNSSNCFIINNLLNYTNFIPCSRQNNCTNIKLFYYNEKNEFIFVCQKPNKFLISIIKNNIYGINKNFNNCKQKTYLNYNSDLFIEDIYNKLIQDFYSNENSYFTQNKNLRSLSEETKAEDSEIFSFNDPNETLVEVEETAIIIMRTHKVKFIPDTTEGLFSDEKSNPEKEMEEEDESHKTVFRTIDTEYIANTTENIFIDEESEKITNTNSYMQESNKMLESSINTEFIEHSTELPSEESDTEKSESSESNALSSSIITIETTNKIQETIKMTEIAENIWDLIKPILSQPKEKFIEVLDKVMGDDIVKKGNTYKIAEPNFTLIIKPTNSNAYNDLSNIDFSKCEEIIRKTNNFNDSSILTLLQLEINNDHNQSLIDQVEYRIYDDNKNPIDISICKDTDIIINHSLDEEILSMLDIESIKELKKSGVNAFDIHDRFFNDLCYPFTFQGMDIVLEDRRGIIYQNFSLCEQGCNNTNIDLEKKISTCQCKVKAEMTNHLMNNNFQKDDEIKLSSTNLDVLKCTDLIFDFSNKSNNIGFILFCILIIFYLIIVLVHCYKGIKSVSDFVYNQMIKYNYIKIGNRKFFQKGKKIKKIAFQQNRRSNNTLLPNENNNRIIKKKKKTIITNDNNINININNNSSRRIIKSTNILFGGGRRKGDDDDLISNPPIKKTIIKKKKVILKKKNNAKSSGEIDNLGIIKVDLNNPREKIYTKESTKTLHNFSFDNPNRYEGRSIFTITYIFLLSKQIVFHTFLEKSPLVPRQIDYSILIFMICFDLSINALFYGNSNISKNSKSKKNLFSNSLSNNTIIIILSCLASLIVLPIIIKFSKVDNAIRNIFATEEKKIRKNKNYKIDIPMKTRVFNKVENALKYYRTKLGFFLFFVFILILGFCYFITAFCQVYPNTQKSLLINFLIAILIRFGIELLLCLLFAKLYLVAAKVEYVTFFKFMLFVYDLSC